MANTFNLGVGATPLRIPPSTWSGFSAPAAVSPEPTGSSPAGSAISQRFGMMRQLDLMESLLEMLTTMLGGGGSPGPGLWTGSPLAPVSSGPEPAGSSYPATATTPVGATAPAPPPTGGRSQGAPGRVGSGSRVLVIGDSHTAGTYGNELDRQLRLRGARVHTVGSSGASATNFVNGRGTTVGYSEHGTDGRVQRTARHATPRLEDMINQDKPDVIVVNLGANFRGASPAQLQSQVASLGEVARRHNIPIRWVGPPKPRQADAGKVQQFDQQMAAAVAPYGEYISSVPFTPEYAGSDGVHYSGARGTQLAQQWAQGVAGQL